MRDDFQYPSLSTPARLTLTLAICLAFFAIGFLAGALL